MSGKPERRVTQKNVIRIAVMIELLNRQREAYAYAANNVRLGLKVKRKTAPSGPLKT